MTKLKQGVVVAVLAVAGTVANAAGPAAGAYPSFGLRLTPPAGGKDVAPAGPGRVATFELPDGALILIEIQSARGQSAEALAKTFAGKSGAIVAAGEAAGGERLATFEAPLDAAPFTGRRTSVVVHNGWAYVFSALRTASSDPTAAYAALLKSVQFTPAKPPAGELEALSDAPVEAFGRFSINLARVARPVKADEKIIHFGIYDYTDAGRLKNPLNIDFERVQIGAPRAFADIRDAYGQALQKQTKAPAAFAWKADPKVPGLHLSQPQTVGVQRPDGTATRVTNRYCVLELAPGDFVQMLFTVSDVPAADLAAYNDSVDRMLKTVTTRRPARTP